MKIVLVMKNKIHFQNHNYIFAIILVLQNFKNFYKHALL